MPAVMKISDRIVVLNFGQKIAGGHAARNPGGREGDRGLSRHRRRDDRTLSHDPSASLDVELYYDHVYALKGVSLEVNEGETVALIGANGAGKSSILRAITGLRRIRAGEIHFEGQRIDGASPDAIVKMGIAMVPGRAARLPLHVREGQSPDGRLHPLRQGRDRDARSTWCSTRFPRLKERYSQAAGTMSGGEQQMLVIGRALMAKPRLLLLDEPSLGIAPKLVQDIARSIVAINRDEKVSVLLVEQNSRMALRISHRAYALTTGTVALSGNSAELLTDERVKQLYLGGEL